VPANQAKYQQALQNASQTLGATGIPPPAVTLAVHSRVVTPS
jgi:hypothetical protein